jgi:inner membrane protein
VDNVCHTLVGAACGEAGLKHRTRFGNATLMLAANLPDVDVLVFLTDVVPVSFRRGWTHGVVAQALLPVALTLVMVAVDRWRPRRSGNPPVRVGWLLALSYVGVYTHVFLDFLNNYGIRLLAPFDWRWFYGDAVFIVDIWLWLALGLGVWLARRQRTPRAAQGALVVAACYIAFMLVSAGAAREEVADVWRRQRGATSLDVSSPQALMVGPVPVTPFTRTVIVDAGDYYELGSFSWWSRSVTFDPRPVPKNGTGEAVAAARARPEVQDVLVWARFPYWTVEPDPDSGLAGARVKLGDVRFFGQGAGRLGVSVVVPLRQQGAPGGGR